ncbi:hypothetical protein [Capnocytophaga catalasegens]|uniref:hypothetical protein n=1 Tax=Capnocytophaga catalasegens TaxID=1004260 RepID=UPI002231F729|nr:hypothetical protein [Capnocytophaga catalasegens]
METLQFLSVKDIMRLLKCSKNTASKIRIDIAEYFSISRKYITYEHLKQYLKL